MAEPGIEVANPKPEGGRGSFQVKGARCKSRVLVASQGQVKGARCESRASQGCSLQVKGKSRVLEVCLLLAGAA